MRLVLPVAAVVLLTAGAAAGMVSDALRATPRPVPGVESLLGGLSALAVQVLWMRADQAMMEHREEDAQLLLGTITELEPQLVGASDYVARIIGLNLAEGHADPAVRWALGREGWNVLTRCVKRNPGDARALACRGDYALLRIFRDPPMRQGFVKDVDAAGPLEAARRDFEEAVRLRPSWPWPWEGLGHASLHRGIEHLFARRFAESAKAARRAREAFDHVALVMSEEHDPDLAEEIALARESGEIASAIANVADAPEDRRRSMYDALRKAY